MAENLNNSSISEGAKNRLNSISTGNSSPALNVNDNFNLTSELSPDELSAYEQQYKPVTGRLPNEAYYPDLGHNIAVGNYSGKAIGSTTLFAPGGGLVPLGAMDAREAAIQQAAMKKIKDLEDFKSKYNAPVTKHSVVQKDLTSSYFEGLQKWRNEALRKTGGNQIAANALLDKDTAFQQWNQGMQDTAKFHDSIIQHSANLQSMEKDPNFVLSPELKKLDSDILSGIIYQGQNPFDERGRGIGEKFLASKALYDLDVASNQAIDKAIPTLEQLPLQFQQRGTNELVTQLEKEYFTPAQVDGIAHEVYMTKFYGTDVSEDMVKKAVQAKLGEKLKRKIDNYKNVFSPSERAAAGDDYSDEQPLTETEQNITGADVTGQVKTGGVVGFNAYKTKAKDEAKRLRIPIREDMVDANNEGIKNKTGYVEGTVSQIELKYYDENAKRYLTKEEVAKKRENGQLATSHNLKVKPVAILNAPTVDEGGNESENTIIVPIEEIKGKYTSPAKTGGQKDFDDKVQELQDKAKEENAKRKAPSNVKEVKRRTADGKIAIFDEATKKFLRYE
jgi:hypothetical protein